jgi:pimeloyl-ACP methyl ester carboxylesterase
MRVIGISGMRSFRNPVWMTICASLRETFPGVSIRVEEDAWCEPWEIRRMRRFIDRLVDTYDDGKPTLLIGHSLGGVYSCAIANRFRQTKVHGIVSIFAPHGMFGGFFPRVLSAHQKLNVPIITVHGERDKWVRWGTKHPQSAVHLSLDADHYLDLANTKRLADTIVRTTSRHIFI